MNLAFHSSKYYYTSTQCQAPGTQRKIRHSLSLGCEIVSKSQCKIANAVADEGEMVMGHEAGYGLLFWREDVVG